MSLDRKEDDKPHICFVALNCYNIIARRKDIEHVGGAEVQQALIAKWLVKQGHRVTFVTYDHGQPDEEIIDGIRIIKASSKHGGIPVIRFVYPRWVKLHKALHRADADVYYQRGAGAEIGQTAMWCRLRNKPFVFGAANLLDFDPALPSLYGPRDRWLYKIGLKLTPRIIAQTNEQRALLLKNFGYESELVRSCGEPADVPPNPAQFNTKRVLWIGRIVKAKRFEWVIQLARSLPEISFDVVGAQNSESEYGRNLLDEAKSIPNIQLHGHIPHAEIGELYKNHAILCSTSLSEGFPNTFLEAWGKGLPVVTTVDPDNLVAENKCGWVAKDLTELTEILDRVLRQQGKIAAASERSRSYYLSAHTPDATLPEFARIMSMAAKGA